MSNTLKFEINTTQQTPLNQLTVEEGIQRINNLSERRASWEKTEYDRSNQTLYTIIEECLRLYEEMTAGAFALVMKQALLEHIHAKGHTFKSSTPLTQKIIRCVFGDQDRRRISTYNKVLVAAIANGWNVGEVPQQIIKAGGIHMISVRKPASVQEDQNYEFAISTLKSSSIATLTSESIKANMKSDRLGEMAVAVLTQMPDGSYNVHCVVPNDKLVRDCMGAYYKTHKKILQKNQEIQKSTEKSKIQAELIDNAADAANDAKQKMAA